MSNKHEEKTFTQPGRPGERDREPHAEPPKLKPESKPADEKK